VADLEGTQARAAEPLFREAARLLQTGDAGAATLLPRLEAFPGYAPGWLALGEVLRARGQQAAAILAFRRAAAAGDMPALLHRAGQGLAALGQASAAEAAFRRALSLDADFAPAWYSLGLALQDSRDFAGAAEAFGQALARKPDFHEAAFNRAVVLQEAGKMDAALLAYAAAYQLRPESFGRIAQALVASPQGTLWLKPSALRAVFTADGG
jgi:tetratricopeptide (TPR) repeat protein